MMLWMIDHLWSDAFLPFLSFLREMLFKWMQAQHLHTPAHDARAWRFSSKLNYSK